MVDYEGILWETVSLWPAPSDRSRRESIYRHVIRSLDAERRSRQPSKSGEEIEKELIRLTAAATAVEQRIA